MTCITITTSCEKNLFVKDIGIAFFASILIALAAPFSLPLPFTPIPLILQVQVALMVAMLLGAKRGGMALLFLLMEGAMGLPVFSGGACGIYHLLGPRGGYLFGYMAAAFVVGYLQERSARKGVIFFRNMVIGNLIIYLCGWVHLASFIGIKKAFILGVFPFILGDLLKNLTFTKIGLLFMRGERENVDF